MENLFDLCKDIQQTNDVTEKKGKNNKTINNKDKDLLLKQENLSSKLSERKKDNIQALEILHVLENSNKSCSIADKRKLAKYAGWGGLSKCFDKEKDFADYYKIFTLVSSEEYASMEQSTLTSFYTPLYVIKFMYKVLKHMGFDKGNILDPSAGTGRFIAGMNIDTYYKSKITAIELDNVSSKICSKLYPNITVINDGYEKVDLPDNNYDLIISNIPFGNIPVFDANDKELNDMKLNIHNYYFAKSLKKLRKGGIIAFVTSTSTLDSESNKGFREYINSQCDFLGAVRLPQGTFVDTSVCSDIIFLKKTEKENTLSSFVESDITLTGVKSNIYFVTHPEMVLGTLQNSTNQYGKQVAIAKYDDVKDTKALSQELNKKVKNFARNVYRIATDDIYLYDKQQLIPCTDYNIRKGEHVLINDKIYQRQKNVLVPREYKGEMYNIYKDYIMLKDEFKNIIDIQANNYNDIAFKKSQSNLNMLYDNFVNLYGQINSNSSKIALLKDDIYFYNLTALETFDPKTEKFYKASIFKKRSLNEQVVKPIATVRDAFILSYTNKGKLDIEYICSLFPNSNKQDIIDKLKEEDLIYYIPYENKYVSKADFIAGNVKMKLEVHKHTYELIKSSDKMEAKEKELLLKEYTRNIKVLESNQPERITDVYFKLSSTWIPKEIKEKFISQILQIPEEDIILLYSSKGGYTLHVNRGISYRINREYGTKTKTADYIINQTLNMKAITITHKKTGEEKATKDLVETQEARNQQEKIEFEFSNYIKNNIPVYNKLLDVYNNTFNTDNEYKYFNILDVDSLNINPNIKPRKHQLIAASRIITSDHNTLLAHSVGSGKTIAMVLASQELKRISHFNHTKPAKSLFVIPKSLCENGQFAREYLQLYPNAKILSTTSNDFKPENLRKLISKMAINEYDAIIISHSSLIKIPLKPQTEKEIIQKQLQELNNTIRYYKENDEHGRDRFTIKNIQKSAIDLKTKIEKLNNTPTNDGILYWEDLNITHLFVDEAHRFKNLNFVTRLQAAGIDGNKNTQKTNDLYNKIQYLRKVNGDGCITFATATPVSNSMCELYTLQKYLMPDDLEELGIDCFDAWASVFGEVVNVMEIDVTGTSFKQKQRFSHFHNIPELIKLFRRVADIVNIKDVKDITLPSMKTGKPINIILEPTKKMQEYTMEMVERAKAIEEKKVPPEVDNMLVITNEGRKLSVSPKLIYDAEQNFYPVNESSIKVKAVADNLIKLYHKYPNTTHLVFCDLGCPGSTTLNPYCVYDDLKEELEFRGMKSNEIAFIHDASSPKKRKELIDKFNAGKIKVLVGSTDKMGEGLNVQRYCKSLHHLSVPWRPSDIEQRVGRILRQGNLNDEIEEYRYVIKRSFDAFTWQIIENKAKYISQIFEEDTSIRDIEDIGSHTFSYAETKACACGDDRILELNNLQLKERKLKFLKKAYHDRKLADYKRLKQNSDAFRVLKVELPKLQNDIKVLKQKVAEREAFKFVDYDFIDGTNAEQVFETIKTLKRMGISGKWGTIFGLDIVFIKETSRIYVGSSNLLFINSNQSSVNILKSLFGIKNNIASVFMNKYNRIKLLNNENKIIKENINKPFEGTEELQKTMEKVKELQTALLIKEQN